MIEIERLSQILQELNRTSLAEAAERAASAPESSLAAPFSVSRLHQSLKKRLWLRIGERFRKEAHSLPRSEIERVLYFVLKAAPDEFFLPLSVESFISLAEALKETSQRPIRDRSKVLFREIENFVSTPKAVRELSQRKTELFRLLELAPSATVKALARAQAHLDEESRLLARRLLTEIDQELQKKGERLQIQVSVNVPSELREVLEGFQFLEQEVRLKPSLFAESEIDFERSLREAAEEAERVFSRPIFDSFSFKRSLLVSFFLAKKGLDPSRVFFGTKRTIVEKARIQPDSTATFLLSGWLLFAPQKVEPTSLLAAEFESKSEDAEWTLILIKAGLEVSRRRRRLAAESFLHRVGLNDFLRYLPELTSDLPPEELRKVFSRRKTAESRVL